MDNFKRHIVTAALPYANGPIHIGHLAGVYIPADIYVRYLRAINEDVIFISGSDEHGASISIKAMQENITPQNIVNKYHKIIKKSFKDFGISFDIYSRTTDKIHKQTATKFFKTLYKKNVFIEKNSMQYYDNSVNQFLADRYITGTCPYCNYEYAYGDQCEKCGISLNSIDLINPISQLSNTKPILKKTKHWYLPLDKYESWLKNWIKSHERDWKTNVYGQCKSWIDSGLQSRPITRDINWGIDVPLKSAKGKVLYVWFDAPIGYISATKKWSKKSGIDWKLYWKNKNTRLIHFIGKDNIVFHSIIFPVMLKEEGSYILPDNIPAFEFLNLENRKISTSRNWAVWLHEYLQDFPNKEDVLRYVLISNGPETKDSNFTWKDFQTKNNAELVGTFGNFINRTLILTEKYFDSKIPKKYSLTDDDKIVWDKILQHIQKIATNIDKFKFKDALNELMSIARIGNKYLTDNEPWKTYNTNEERTKTVLNLSLQICANLSILSEPFLPFTSKKLSKMLKLKKLKWKDAGNINILKSDNKIRNVKKLFDKIENSEIELQIMKLKNK